ncbi:hypothetical protein AB0K08_11645 [Citricoccus sp. NPDC055426]|uniref:type IV toxin-antitoxin system AbiEi family antitoxin domain-containing protein n=1 Tax=Citricoccus sp. NPDC055426 TaxID=3155536 RepID=UPI00343C59A3
MSSKTLPDLLQYRELKNLGLTRHHLDLLVQRGEYERIAPGTFMRTDAVDDTTAAWMAIAAKRPEATLCLLTALSLHDLTDEIPRKSHIAIPRGTHPIAVLHAPVSWHRFSVDTFLVGRTEHTLPGGMTIGLYSAERTIIDLFRLRHEWGTDLALGALKRWLKVRGNSAGTLLSMALPFAETRPALHNALEILL